MNSTVTISRIIDGKEVQIELTHSEMYNAYRMVEIKYLIEDIESCMERMEIDIPDSETLNSIAGQAQRSLEMNDGYWEAYWNSIEHSVQESMDL